MEEINGWCPSHGDSYPSIDTHEFEGDQTVVCNVCGRKGFVVCDWDHAIGEDMSHYEWK